MSLHYIVQGHRFDIVEDFGCRPAVYISVASIFLFWLPPVAAILLTLFFASLAVRHFYQRRLTFARHLQNSNSALTISRYFRLMAMAVTQMLWGTLVIGIDLWFSCQYGLRPWISWANVHSNFSRIGLFPTLFIPRSTLTWTYFIWWTIPIDSFIFFCFFAFGQDAMKEYGACFQWIRRVLFRQSRSDAAKSTSYSTPSFVRCLPVSSQIPKVTISSAASTTDTKTEFDDESMPATPTKDSGRESFDTPCFMAISNDTSLPPYNAPPVADHDPALPTSRHAEELSSSFSPHAYNLA